MKQWVEWQSLGFVQGLETLYKGQPTRSTAKPGRCLEVSALLIQEQNNKADIKSVLLSL